MSYTNSELVRKHIGLNENRSRNYLDHPVIFEDLAEIDLPGSGIVKGSAALKRVIETSPTYRKIEVTAEPFVLEHQRIVPGSVTASSDSSLGQVYILDVDYAIEYEPGIFKCLPGGAITPGQEISLWYFYYSLYDEGSDYSIDYDRGTIRRLAGGEIIAGQTLRFDYATPYQYLSFDLLNEAVTEANAVVEKEVDPNKMFGADLMLQTAATYLAASILCRAAAAENLRTSINAKGNISSWLSLAESFRADYEHLIKIFRPGKSRMSGPKNT